MKFLFLIFISALCHIVFSSAVLAQGWTELGNGLVSQESTITALATDPAGNVYASGYFGGNETQAYVSYVAQWIGNDWSVIGNWYPNHYIRVLATDKDGNLYAAGDFTDGTTGSCYVAKWDGHNWTKLTGGSTIGPLIQALAIADDGTIYAGGVLFDEAHSYYVAKWDGTSWTRLMDPSFYGIVQALAVDHSGKLYAGGNILLQNNNYLAHWNGSNWLPVDIHVKMLGTVGYYLNGDIQALDFDEENNLYAAGSFENDTVGFNGTSYVAKWDGITWSEVGQGEHALNTHGSISTIAVAPSGNIYAAGTFMNQTPYYDGTFIHLSGSYYVAQWNGTQWSELATNNDSLRANGSITDLVLDQNENVYVSGNFKNNSENLKVAKWSASPLNTSIPHASDTPELTSYPNPAHDQIQLSIQENGTLQLYHFSGQYILTKEVTVPNTQLDLSALPSGIYTLLFNGQHSSSSLQVIKE
ncbi:MAG: hypothetical protein JWM14_3475 [Chitinophagaceae bacterium]|nr:hypothetical protein [Chitinophagaceae bacterium]